MCLGVVNDNRNELKGVWNIIFYWILQEQKIIDTIFNNITHEGCSIKEVSLLCYEETLREQLQKDIDDNYRTSDIIEKSIRDIAI